MCSPFVMAAKIGQAGEEGHNPPDYDPKKKKAGVVFPNKTKC